jgi:hypothetical protein
MPDGLEGSLYPSLKVAPADGACRQFVDSGEYRGTRIIICISYFIYLEEISLVSGKAVESLDANHLHGRTDGRMAAAQASPVFFLGCGLW